MTSWPARRRREALALALLIACAAEDVPGQRAISPHSDATLTRVDSRPSTLPAAPLRVVAFYSSTCHDCYKAKKALADSARRWGSRVQVEHKDVSVLANFREMFKYEDHYGCKSQSPPKVFVGSQYLEGYSDIAEALQDVITQELKKGSVTFMPLSSDTAGGAANAKLPEEVLARFSSFSAGAVAIAGLLDGINPCAFTTIIFLISMLAYLGKSRRQMAAVGIGFTCAVFGTYFLLGLGLLETIRIFSVSSGISITLAYAAAALAFALAAWSFVDFARYTRSGDVKKVTLGLPRSVKARIHKVIREGLKTRGLVIGSVTVGALVALLESLCTGQVYLPTIIFVARAPGLRANAIAYLLFYNLMFIVPLLIILGVAYLGVSSERLGTFLRRHLAALKLAMAVLFAGLGVLVLATL